MPFPHPSFASTALYREQPESMKGFLSKRWTFWLALFSCFAFLIGNMVGQHGIQAFWKAVWGKEATEIVFTGTMYPIAEVPDVQRWSPAANHQYDYSDVPASFLEPFPEYHPLHSCSDGENDRTLLSVDYNGDYNSGGLNCGSHPAADILVPKGTPVLAAMNGIVDRLEERSWGFGNTIVLKHPNVPDPDHPDQMITLYSGYAHLGHIIVSIGQIVQKGQQIAVSGQTGLATAPHLHFQIDREAPFHPYWPFTTTEATEAGYSFTDAVDGGLGREDAERYTINPLAYVAAHKSDAAEVLLADAGGNDQVRAPQKEEKISDTNNEAIPQKEESTTPKLSLRERILKNIRDAFTARRDARKAERIARLDERSAPLPAAPVQQEVAVVTSSSSAAAAVPVEQPQAEIPKTEAVLSTAETDIPMPVISGNVTEITMLHDGAFHDGWEEIVLFARDAEGRFLRTVQFEGSLYLDTVFGDADFSPSALTAEQFDAQGRAVVRMMPRISGNRSIVPMIRGAFEVRGEPMVFNPGEAVWDERIVSETLSLQGEAGSQ